MVGWNFRPFSPRSAARFIWSSASVACGSTDPNPISTPGYLPLSSDMNSLPSQPRPVTDSSSQSRTTPSTSRSRYSSATWSIVFRSGERRKYRSVASRCGPMAFRSHSSVGRWTCRSIAFGNELLLAVVVEPLAGLPAEEPRLDHPARQRRRSHVRVAELLVQDLGDGHHRVEPDQVQKLE